MVFCNKVGTINLGNLNIVTILILIDGFLQYNWWKQVKAHVERHNPYFNRWFSAIQSINRGETMFMLSQSLF